MPTSVAEKVAAEQAANSMLQDLLNEDAISDARKEAKALLKGLPGDQVFLALSSVKANHFKPKSEDEENGNEDTCERTTTT